VKIFVRCAYFEISINRLNDIKIEKTRHTKIYICIIYSSSSIKKLIHDDVHFLSFFIHRVSFF
jgi:hypothetical protein